jgi:hypothetical protein
MGIPGLTGKAKLAIAESNKVNAAMWSLCDLAHQHGVVVCIENPGKSILWHTKAMKRWQQMTGANEISLDFCKYGANYVKHTKFYVTASGFEGLVQRCDHAKGIHDRLSGWKDLDRPERKLIPTASASAAYPPALCAALALKVKDAIC